MFVFDLLLFCVYFVQNFYFMLIFELLFFLYKWYQMNYFNLRTFRSRGIIRTIIFVAKLLICCYVSNVRYQITNYILRRFAVNFDVLFCLQLIPNVHLVHLLLIFEILLFCGWRMYIFFYTLALPTWSHIFNGIYGNLYISISYCTSNNNPTFIWTSEINIAPNLIHPRNLIDLNSSYFFIYFRFMESYLSSLPGVFKVFSLQKYWLFTHSMLFIFTHMSPNKRNE